MPRLPEVVDVVIVAVDENWVKAGLASCELLTQMLQGLSQLCLAVGRVLKSNWETQVQNSQLLPTAPRLGGCEDFSLTAD